MEETINYLKNQIREFDNKANKAHAIRDWNKVTYYEEQRDSMMFALGHILALKKL